MVIGIGGISRSGKTTLSLQLVQQFGSSAVALHQDEFVAARSLQPRIQHGDVDRTDWEAPGSLDFSAFIAAIDQAQKTHSVVIADGLMVFWDAELYRRFHAGIFLSISKKTFIERKNRDLRWGRVPDWYREHIWLSHQKYGQVPPNFRPILRLSGEQPITTEPVMRFLMEVVPG
ncbi:MAG TPA: hypothetical protein PLL64_11225 [Rhodothermales bacterium]|nr:hypothetical protein [Rhodothermales bacterium]HRR07146.1 hypothetical protein [Rhodothermales bacterium]